MKQNKYDDPDFFLAYSKMTRSIDGLAGAGEWEKFREHLPALQGKRVLDLGCGYGWHCQFALEQGASEVIGLDLSEKMLSKAKALTSNKNISYVRSAIEDFDAPPHSFDVIFSSLALHYIKDLGAVFSKVKKLLVSGGVFYYSVEHPIFTSIDKQDWIYKNDTPQHWPVDNYFDESERVTTFLGSEVVKYHRTIESHLSGLLANGFEIQAVLEPLPPIDMVEKMEWWNELRRPMMLIIKVVKK